MDPYRRIKSFTLLATLLWSSIFLTSCATLTGCSGCSLSYTQPYKPPSFTLIQVSLELKPSKCTVVGTGTDCEGFLALLPPKTINTRGSGTVVSVVNNKTYVLTADHVCSHPDESSFTMSFKPLPDSPPVMAKIIVKQKTIVTAVDGDGIPHSSIVHATDCLLYTSPSPRDS